MKILIDLQAAQASNRDRGIGRYTLALTQELLSLATHHDVEIMLSRLFPETIEPLRAVFSEFILPSKIITWQGMSSTTAIQKDNEWRRETSERIRESFITYRKPDIVYLPSVFEGGVDDAVVTVNHHESKIPTAATIFDLIPWLYKKPYLDDPKIRVWYERQLNHLKRANLWLAISESSRQDAIQQLHLPEEQVINTSCAASPLFRKLNFSPEEKKVFLHQYQIVRPFVMYTAGIDYRKNFKNLLAAYANLPMKLRDTHQLVIVCAAHDDGMMKLKQAIFNAGLQENEVILTGFVSDETLVKFYNMCTAFVFPSLYEGFGLPVLEAMACGAAVIGSNTSSIPEVIGYEAALFNPLDVNDIATKLHAVLTQSDFRLALQEHAIEQSKKFTWQASAAITLDALERLYDAKKQSVLHYAKVENMQPRRKLAYISPLPPEKTGIAYYSSELLSELTRHYDIDVITDQKIVTDVRVKPHCSIRSVTWFKKHAHEYDGRILYHMGNSIFHQDMFPLLERYPGIVVLHDFFLSGIISHVEYHEGPKVWAKALYDAHGYNVLSERYQNVNLREMVYKYPANFHVLQQASAIISHSQFSFQLAKHWYGESIDKILWEHIPLLRVLPPIITPEIKKQARISLSFKENDFIVCSFGLTGQLKLNERLLEAWLESSLSTDSHCYLLFVGENADDEFGQKFAKRVDSCQLVQPVVITGYVSQEHYNQYLIAADVAVQLRTQSQGETSAAVLDCMKYGLPTILNRHGAMAEISKECVYFISEDFSNTELKEALLYLKENVFFRDEIGKKAREYIERYHAPRKIADHYFNTIEKFIHPKNNRQQRQIHLMQDAVQSSYYRMRKKKILNLAEIVVDNEPSIRQKQMLYDISELVQRDAQSGIQRAVRGYLIELLKKPPKGYRFEPIYREDDDDAYYYARNFISKLLNCEDAELVDDRVEVYSGDIFIAIDLVATNMAQRVKNYQQWREKGIFLFFMIYDLLCIQHPEFFIEGAYEHMSNWLTCVASQADGVICISETVAREFNVWLEKTKPTRYLPLNVHWLHLGTEQQTKVAHQKQVKQINVIISTIASSPSILMVGTIEGRKGHDQTLKAFELLWARGINVNWVIVGKVGWKTKELVQLLRRHPEKNKRLFWFENATDDILNVLYEKSQGCLMASEGEGFGLPLIEAAKHQLPILARNLPVFREVAGNYATYFSGKKPEDLAYALEAWLHDLNQGTAIASKGLPRLTWAESTQQLLDIIFNQTPSLSPC